MTEKQYQKFCQFLVKFYNDTKITKEQWKLWYEVYRHLNYEVCLLRLSDCMNSEKYIPMPCFFAEADDYIFWIENRQAMSKQMIEKIESMRRLVEG